MSNEALTWAFKTQIKNPGAKFVLVSLANYADENNRCFPSRKHLCKMTGIAERTITEHLAFLEKEGLLKMVPRFIGGKGQTSSIYEVGAPLAESARPPSQNLLGPLAESATHSSYTKSNTEESPSTEGISDKKPTKPETPGLNAVWTDFKALLIVQGNEEKSVGGMIGKLIRSYSAERVGRLFEANRDLICEQVDAYGYFVQILKQDKTLNKDEADLQLALKEARYQHNQLYAGGEFTPPFDAARYVVQWPVLQRYVDEVAAGTREEVFYDKKAKEKEARFTSSVLEQAKFYGRI